MFDTVDKRDKRGWAKACTTNCHVFKHESKFKFAVDLYQIVVKQMCETYKTAWSDTSTEFYSLNWRKLVCYGGNVNVYTA